MKVLLLFVLVLIGCDGSNTPEVIAIRNARNDKCAQRCNAVGREMDKEISYTLITSCNCKDEVKK